MPGSFDKRLADAEARTAARSGSALHVFFEPKGCPDPTAFAKVCEAEAGTGRCCIVRFVAPSQHPSARLQ